MKKLLHFIVLFFGLTSVAFAAPTIDNSTPTTGWTHGSSITIYSGATDFGTKSPAAPLWWDDMEGASNGSTTFTSGELSWVTSGYWSGTNKHYSEAIPANGTETSALMTYRSVGYRSVGAPHSRSTKYAAAGHWQFDNNDPWYGNSEYQNIALTVDSGAADKGIWFAHFYYRVDPNWTLINDASNHKKTAVNVGTTIYGSQPNNYVVSQGLSEGKAAVSGDMINYDVANIASCSRTETLTGANAMDSWIAIEQHYDSPVGRHEIWTFDGSSVGSGLKNYTNAPYTGCDGANDNSRSYSAGGWFCTNSWTTGDENKRGHQDNFRYYDDLYVDNTFSRVVLTDNATYSSSTIVEPQIPSAWSTSQATVTINQGNLPNGTAYLFVFDSSNDHNATGYAVTVGSTAPTTVITSTDPQTNADDPLSVVGTASDDTAVTSCKYRVGSAPDASNGTACSGTTSWTCSIDRSAFPAEGANTLYVGCTDADANWGAGDSITVYNPVAGTVKNMSYSNASIQ